MNYRSNSITIHIDEYSVAARVRQLRSEHKRTSRQPITFVIVEGEIIDPLIYHGLFNNSRCHIVPAFGKKNAVNTIAILEKESFQGVIAIVDDDYDTLNQSRIEAPNIVPTDTHDVECLIIKSPALEKLLLHLLPPDKRNFQDHLAKDVRKHIIELATPLGYIRWHFSATNKQGDFSEINFVNFIDVKRRQCNINGNVKEVLSKNKDCGVSEDDLLLFIREKIEDGKDVWWLVCQGHDLIRVLAMLLPAELYVYAPRDKTEQRRYFESIQPIVETDKNIVQHLAMCYEKAEFVKTDMYARIIDWESKNPPYIIMQQ